MSTNSQIYYYYYYYYGTGQLLNLAAIFLILIRTGQGLHKSVTYKSYITKSRTKEYSYVLHYNEPVTNLTQSVLKEGKLITSFGRCKN